VAKSGSSLADLAAANTLNDLSLIALGGRAPEKWERLAVGPQLNDGSYLLLAGTDNDYSVTQNGSNVQFDDLGGYTLRRRQGRAVYGA